MKKRSVRRPYRPRCPKRSQWPLGGSWCSLCCYSAASAGTGRRRGVRGCSPSPSSETPERRRRAPRSCGRRALTKVIPLSPRRAASRLALPLLPSIHLLLSSPLLSPDLLLSSPAPCPPFPLPSHPSSVTPLPSAPLPPPNPSCSNLPSPPLHSPILPPIPCHSLPSSPLLFAQLPSFHSSSLPSTPLLCDPLTPLSQSLHLCPAPHSTPLSSTQLNSSQLPSLCLPPSLRSATKQTESRVCYALSHLIPPPPAASSPSAPFGSAWCLTT